jgi:hypothetical protein
MSRAGLRVVVGLAMVVAMGLLFAPLLAPAGAEPRRPGAPTATTVPRTTIPPVTTVFTLPPTTLPIITTPLTTLPPFVPLPTTPTTQFVPVTRPAASSTTTTAPATTTTTSTTIAAIPGGTTPVPVTLPLASEPQSASISPFFSIMSGLGFLSLVLLLGAQVYLTRPGRRGPTL